MPTLSDLSTELLLAIFSHVTPASHSNLSLTNRRLYQLVNPILYENLYFCAISGVDCTGNTFPNDWCSSLEPPLKASRVYKLDLLTQSLQRSPKLRSLILRVELDWNVDEGKVLGFLDIIQHSRLQSLVLSPPSLYFQIPDHTKVTTLNTRHYGHEGGSDEDVVPDIDQLHKLCCIPSLNEISVDGWQYWSMSVTSPYLSSAELDAPLKRAKTSPITVLRISTVGTPGHVFNDILSWPKSLCVFHFECAPPVCEGYQLPGKLDTEDFIKPLQHCRDTLEELSIHCVAEIGDSMYHP